MNNEELINLITKEVLTRLNAILNEKCPDEQKDPRLINIVEKDVCSMEKNNDGCFIDFTDKKLICETDLKNILKCGIEKILASKKTIVTPLAMDFMRANKLQLQKK